MGSVTCHAGAGSEPDGRFHSPREPRLAGTTRHQHRFPCLRMWEAPGSQIPKCGGRTTPARVAQSRRNFRRQDSVLRTFDVTGSCIGTRHFLSDGKKSTFIQISPVSGRPFGPTQFPAHVSSTIHGNHRVKHLTAEHADIGSDRAESLGVLELHPIHETVAALAVHHSSWICLLPTPIPAVAKIMSHAAGTFPNLGSPANAG
jgi:hypothetical protein